MDKTNNYDLPPSDQTSPEMIDESTNDEVLGYYDEQPQYSDCEIKDKSETIVNTSDTEAIQSSNGAKKKSKTNIFACNICNRSFTQVLIEYNRFPFRPKLII
jgi:hypothetical protein